MSKRNHKKRNGNSEYNSTPLMDDEETAYDTAENEADESEDWDAFINGADEEEIHAEVTDSSSGEEVKDAVTESAEEIAVEADESTATDAKNPEPEVENTVSDMELAESLKRAVVEALSDDTPDEEQTEAEQSKNGETEEAQSESEQSGDEQSESKEAESNESEDRQPANEQTMVETDVRKEAARVARDRREREKNKVGQQNKEDDEKRELRHKRRVRNQVISYLTIVLFILVLLAGVFLVYWMFFRKSTDVSQPTDGKITVSEGTEQTEEIINDMLGMEDDVSEPVEEPEEEEIITEPEEDLLGDYVDGIISGMTIEEKVAGLFIVTPESITGTTVATVAGDATKAALDKYCVGGIIYSNKNINTKEQFSLLIEKTAEMVKYPTFLAIAEEGGNVAPLAAAGYYDAEETASHIAASEEVTGAYSAGVSIGFAMNQIGLNLNLAPVADLSIVEGNILGTRAYADTAGNTAGYVISMMQGIEDGKVTSCLKYFPGLGMVTEDPANGRVVSARTDEEFSSGEMLVYQAAIENGANMIMMSDVVYSAYSDAPATISNDVVTGLLRERLGYDGIILSANLSDAAISQYYGSDEAAIAALKAGCDMIMCPENFTTAYEAILKAVEDGVISIARVDDALARILRVKYARDFE